MLVLLVPVWVSAQNLHQDVQERLAAEVIEIVDEREREITGTDAIATVQEVRAVLHSGDRAGEVVRFESEAVSLEKGDDIFLNRVVTINGDEYITFADFERRPVIYMLAGLFVMLLVGLSGWGGLRALASLAGSIAAIVFLLIPALLAGYNPALTSVLIAAVIMVFVLFGTHGVNPRTIIAFVGTYSAIAVTGLIAFLSVDMMRLTGFGNDASVYLNFATNGQLDLSGLLLGSVIIGILGVLDDVSITQASVVQELKRANRNFKFNELYKRAIVVGKDHIGSLVNTLALAYVGVSLPLILLYAKTDSSLITNLNQEVVAAEIVRIIIGSIGLLLAVPATTAAAAWWFNDREVDGDVEAGHCHHHHH
tara:strand:- start:416 stop:1513 length:1098 start_codon:yes stop_codon:yes gene_type:complete